MSMITVRRRGGFLRDPAMERVGRTTLNFERSAPAMPGWILDQLAEEKMAAGYTTRNTACPRCFCQRSNTGVCPICD